TPVEQQPDFGQYFTLSVLGGTEQAKLEGPRLHGAGLEVSHLDGGYRGTGRSGVIDLRTEGNKISGNVGAGSTELYVDDGLQGLPGLGTPAGDPRAPHHQPGDISAEGRTRPQPDRGR